MPPRGWKLALLLTGAVAFGGGGVAYGLANLVVQLVALSLLAFHWPGVCDFWRKAPRALTMLAGLTLALPLAQLVPLPPDWWQALPGREAAIAARSVAGVRGWYPLSLDQGRTLVAALGLIAPCTVLMLGWNLRAEALVRLGWLVVALGLASFIMPGAVQVLSDGRSGLLYPENPMPGVLFATFANRNSAGLFFVACLILLTMLAWPGARGGAGRALRIAAGLMLASAIVLTRSRSAMVLALIPLGLVIARLAIAGWRQRHAGHHARLALMLAGGVLLVAGAAALVPGSRVETALARFDQSGDARLAIWDDATHGIRRYWPAGAGMGTFDEVFQIEESLENLTPRRAGRAHDDYLEIALEAGLAGLLLLGAWIVLVLRLTLSARRSEGRWTGWAGSCVLFAVALQSLTDYPLRNQALLCVAAFALLLLARTARDPGSEVP